MRYISFTLFIVYILFARWQLNDPDPLWWTFLYLVAAYVSFRAFKHTFNIELLVVLAVLYSAYAMQLTLEMSSFEGFFTEGQGMEMKTVNQELLREASGLGICVTSFLGYAGYAYYKKHKSVTMQHVV